MHVPLFAADRRATVGTSSAMERLDRCLHPDEVTAFIAGALGLEDVRILEGHVALCGECRILLSLVARSDTAASRSLASPGGAAESASGAPDDAGADPVPGTRVGRYLLLERLGAGAMGVVFAAHDPELDRKVAVKVLRGDAGVEPAQTPPDERLVREARAMARLAHPNVVAVHDVGWFGDRVFIAMELVEGHTLAHWLAAERRSLREVIAMFIAAGHGLAAAHAAGLVHRDFKPENVLIGKDGRVRVTDFGVAHRAELPADPGPPTAAAADRRRTTRALAGTPFYMAPEQLMRERVDARTDQFSFCVAIYAALTGDHPFPAGSRMLGLAAGVQRRGALPSWLWRALRPGLSIARDQRYPTIEALLSRLARAPRRRRQIWTAAALALVAAAVAVAARFDRDADAVGPTCEGAERLLAGVWDRQRAHAIDNVFRATGATTATAAFASASLLLDQYANRWIAMRTDACRRAQATSSQSEAILNLRIACLDARLSELRVLTGRLTAADAGLVDGAAVAVQGLGKLDVCADDRALRRPLEPDLAPRPGIAVALDADRRRSDFITDSDGTLWQIPIGSDGAEGIRIYVVEAVIGMPAIVLDAQHRWQLFARRVDGLLARAWQDTPLGPWRTETITTAVTDDPAAVVVAGTPVCFVRKLDGWLWRYAQNASSGRGWTAVRVADVVSGRPGVGLDVAGELYSFVRKADGSLWYARHRGLTDPPDRPVKLAERIAGDPTVTHDAVDKLTYYVRRNDGLLIAGYQEAAGSPIWHAVSLTDDVAGNPAVAFDPEGKQICLARKTDGSLWSAVQHTPATGDWHEHILTAGIAGDPTVIRDADDRVVYVARKTDGKLWEGRQDAPLATTWRELALR